MLHGVERDVRQGKINVTESGEGEGDDQARRLTYCGQPASWHDQLFVCQTRKISIAVVNGHQCGAHASGVRKSLEKVFGGFVRGDDE
ncbi:unannotated protein [freshwater metagenome]|uniref:Unannotated protein n=1 Tax=freshwater metagenome TaxID=449393 RepID=A0A6J7JQC2_9ZZZZ